MENKKSIEVLSKEIFGDLESKENMEKVESLFYLVFNSRENKWRLDSKY